MASIALICIARHAGISPASRPLNNKITVAATAIWMMTAYVIGMELKAGRLHMDDDVTITEDAWAKKYTDSSKMFTFPLAGFPQSRIFLKRSSCPLP